MSVAALLLKPTAVSRAVEEDSDKALMQDAFTLMIRILLDGTGKSSDLSTILETTALRMFTRVQNRVGENFRQAGERIQTLLAPLTQWVTGDQAWPQGDTAEQMAHVLELIAQGAGKIETLQITDLRGPIADAVSIVVDDLGFTPDFLAELATAFFEDLSLQLEAKAQTSEGDEKKNTQALAQLIRRLKRKVSQGLALPTLNADAIATATIKLLRKLDMDKAMQAVQYSSGALAEVIEAVDAILDLVPYTGQGTMSIGADQADPLDPDRDYCWYLSWLLGDRYAHRPGWSKVVHGLTSIFNPSPADEIWAQGTTSDFVRHYLFHREQRLYDAGYVDQPVGSSGTYKMFAFDSEASAAATAAEAGVQAVQQLRAAAQDWSDDASKRDAYERAFEKAAGIWQDALDAGTAARDFAQEAQAKAADTLTKNRDAHTAAEAAKTANDNAAAAVQAASAQWNAANLPEARSGQVHVGVETQRIDDLVGLTETAARQAGELAQKAQTSSEKAGQAATKINTAHGSHAGEMPEFASTALTAAQEALTAAQEASTAANEAAAQAAQALTAANATLTSARQAKVRGEEVENGAEWAEDALDDAHDDSDDTALEAAYQAALEAFEHVVDAAESAAEAAKDASETALVARAAAVAVASRPRYAFKHITPETMECWARHTSSVADLIEGFFHGISIERGDFLSNLLLMLYSATSAIYKWAANRPLPQWIEWVTRFLGPFLGCFPYMHYNTAGASKNRTIFWFTYYGKRLIEAHMYYLLAHGTRRALLSILTLANHDPDLEENRPLNFEAIEGFTQLIAGPFIFLWAALTPIEHYAAEQAENDWKMYWLDWVIGGVVYTLISNTVGFLGGIGIARAWSAWDSGWDGVALWANQLWKTFILSILGYFPALFILKENETEDGHYGHDPVYRPLINGYPGRADSPYRLPFQGGPIQCAQGNMGVWSHHVYSYNFQVYAYDFANDFGDRILASRAGTVSDFFDWAPNNEEIWTADIDDPANPGGTLNIASGNNPATGLPFTVNGQTTEQAWNFIAIKHDYDPAHDPVDLFNNPVPTYLIYGHGQNGTIRGDAFNSQEPIDIIGQRVDQGHFIMFSDDTGVSAYNHLHTHVIPGPPDFLDHTESIGTADGTTLQFTATLPSPPIRPCSVHLTFDRVVVARDDGNGRFTGHHIDNHVATIDYASGAITAAWLTGHAPKKDVAIHAYYDQVVMLDTGNGTDLSFDDSGSPFDLTITTAGRVDRVPTPGSVVILLDGVPIAQDDGAGTMVTTIDTANSSIDYANGSATIAWIAGHAPPAQVEIGIPFEETHAAGTGDGSVTTVATTLPHQPVIPETLRVRLNRVVMLTDDWFDGWQTTLDTGASTVNLATGDITIAWQAEYAPPAGVAIQARYQSEFQLGTGDAVQDTFPGPIPNPPITGGSMTVFQAGIPVLTDDGASGFETTLDTGGSTMDHASGNLSIVWQANHRPPAGTVITARFDSSHPVGSGDGATLSFTTTLPNPPIANGSVVILIDGVQAAAENGTFDSFTGANVDEAASSIDHSSGALTIAWTGGNAPGDGAVITARFTSGHTIGTADGNSASFSSALPNAPIEPDSVVIELNGADIARSSGNDFASCVDTAHSTLTHATGNITLVWLADHVPPAGAGITARYESTQSIGNGAVGVASFNTVLPNAPLLAGSVVVMADGADVAMEGTTPASLVPVIDAGTGSIDYDQGALTLNWDSSHPPNSATAIQIDYAWRHHVGTGDNATLSFSTTIPNAPLTPNSVVIQRNDRYAAIDDGGGSFTTHIDGANSTIDYFTGQLNAVAFSLGPAPGLGAVITADYETIDRIGTGSGPANVVFNGRLTGDPIRKGSIRIQLDGAEAATDDGAGSFTGTDIDTAASSINYWDGAFTLAWTAGNGPAVGVHILAVYQRVVPVKTSRLHPYTLPFVYRDVDHSSIYNQKNDGIPRSLSYYNSENTEP